MPLYSGHSRITITMAGGWWPDSRSTRPVLGTKSGMDRGLGGGGGRKGALNVFCCGIH